MTITLDIPEELENELALEAKQLGLSLPEYALRVLYTRPVLEKPIKTGEQLVAYWKNAGLIGSRTDLTDSQEHARRLRKSAEKRK